MKQVRLGIIGMGNMGSAHARMIQSGKVAGLTLGAVCDVNPPRLEGYGEVPKFTEATAMMDSGAVDAVLVATPHYDHVTLGIESLRRRLHTLVEKPIAVHPADSARLVAAHRDPAVVFSAMFNQRTDPHYIKLRGLIQSGELGTLRRVVWNITNWFRTQFYYDSGGWRATWAGEGGGVLLNQCPHQLDLWQWLFGVPQTVTAFVSLGRYHKIEVEDDVTAYMEYANGCKGVFITTTGEAPGSNRLEVTGDRGKVVIDVADGDGLRFIRNEQPMDEFCATSPQAFARPGTWDIKIPIDGRGPQHQGILQNFANAILKGEPLIAPAPDGAAAVELACAMLYSGFTRQTVTLPLDAPAYAAHLEKLIAGSTFKKAAPASAAQPASITGSF